MRPAESELARLLRYFFVFQVSPQVLPWVSWYLKKFEPQHPNDQVSQLYNYQALALHWLKPQNSVGCRHASHSSRTFICLTKWLVDRNGISVDRNEKSDNRQRNKIREVKPERLQLAKPRKPQRGRSMSIIYLIHFLWSLELSPLLMVKPFVRHTSCPSETSRRINASIPYRRAKPFFFLPMVLFRVLAWIHHLRSSRLLFYGLDIFRCTSHTHNHSLSGLTLYHHIFLLNHFSSS